MIPTSMTATRAPGGAFASSHWPTRPEASARGSGTAAAAARRAAAPSWSVARPADRRLARLGRRGGRDRRAVEEGRGRLVRGDEGEVEGSRGEEAEGASRGSGEWWPPVDQRARCRAADQD